MHMNKVVILKSVFIRVHLWFLCCALVCPALGEVVPPSTQPVSFYRDIRPIFVANCNACHKPEKMKAELDMTTYPALMKGGKHGKTVVPGSTADSKMIEEISGDDPDMPKDADPLKAAEVALIT